MTYQLLEQYSSAFVGPAMVPKGFAIHWWGDPAQHPTFNGILNVLLERGQQQSASVHFEAEAGLVACFVPVNRVAWGQGDGGTGWGNLNLVSIECNPRCTAADRETVAELMADQHILNGVPLVAYPHNKFTSTQCPGVWEQHIPWLVSRAKQIVAAKQGKTAAIAPQSTTPKEPFTVSQYDELNEKLAKIEKTTYNTWAGVWTGGTNVDGKKFNYGILPIVAESQRRDAIAQAQISNLVSAIAALSKGEKFDEAKLLAGVQAAAEAGVKAGIATGTVTVDVNVNGGAA